MAVRTLSDDELLAREHMTRVGKDAYGQEQTLAVVMVRALDELEDLRRQDASRIAAEAAEGAEPDSLELARQRVRRLLAGELDRWFGEDGRDLVVYGQGDVAIRNYAEAYVRLGGDLELDPVQAGPSPLEQAAAAVVAACRTKTAEEFPPRLEDLVEPLKALEDAAVATGTTIPTQEVA